MPINANAPVISRHEILIDAPLQVVWDIQTSIAQWPSWQPDVTEVEIDGPLAVGTVFRWLTHGMDITSTVTVLEPTSRIEWGGPAHGIDGVHEWRFTETPDGVLVHTEESWDGEPVRAQAAELQVALDQSLITWLGNLKRAAESRP